MIRCIYVLTAVGSTPPAPAGSRSAQARRRADQFADPRRAALMDHGASAVEDSSMAPGRSARASPEPNRFAPAPILATQLEHPRPRRARSGASPRRSGDGREPGAASTARTAAGRTNRRTLPGSSTLATQGARTVMLKPISRRRDARRIATMSSGRGRRIGRNFDQERPAGSVSSRAATRAGTNRQAHRAVAGRAGRACSATKC